MKPIHVTIWNEFVHEKQSPEVAAIYPDGIHGAIAAMLGRNPALHVRTATLDQPENGLPREVLDSTDVLLWWGHCAHDRVSDEVAARVRDRVLAGMGLIVLHSGHRAKPFTMLMGTSCRLKWRENDEKERLWVVDPGHPIARGLPEYLEIEQEETYGEFFDVPAPEELVLVSWFSGGNIFRSGCCYRRGSGKIFYFRPGHEAYPIYWREDIAKVLENAVFWAAPSGGPVPQLGYSEPLEQVADKFAGKSDAERKHLNL